MGLWPKTTISEHDLILVGLILVATLILSQVLKEYVNSKTKQKLYHKSRKSDTYYFFSIHQYIPIDQDKKKSSIDATNL
jgi:hypothetical protein